MMSEEEEVRYVGCVMDWQIRIDLWPRMLLELNACQPTPLLVASENTCLFTYAHNSDRRDCA